MARAPKVAFIEKMQADVQRAQGLLFVDFTGLTVMQADGLRRKLSEANVVYRVVKNTLMKRVLDNTPFADAAKCLKGTPTGVVLGFEDPVTPAKLTFEFGKDCDKVRVKGGVVDNKAIGAKEAEALSKMPSRTELQGEIVGLAKSPGGKLQAQLKSPSGRIVGAIEALCKRLGGEE